MLAFNLPVPKDVALQIAARVKARRLELDLTQEGLSARAGIKFATYRRFEQTGGIAIQSQDKSDLLSSDPKRPRSLFDWLFQ